MNSRCCSACFPTLHFFSLTKLPPNKQKQTNRFGCIDQTVCFQDAYARGEVFIGSKENSYTVLPGLPPSIQDNHWQFGITIVTPDRKFLFACETEEDQKSWIAAFQIVVQRPMLPQEYAGNRSSHYLALPPCISV